MTKPFTLEDLKALHPCSEGLEWAKRFKLARTAWNKCERTDWMLWFLRRKNLIEKPISVAFAIACAERALPIYEKKYPDDKRPAKAIAAAKAWLENPTKENYKAAASAAAASDAAYIAAAAAAHAAYVAAAADAYAAADAAAAAYVAAAYVAAYVVAAAAAAAGAAASAAVYAAAQKTERRWQADKLRQLVPNPFI